MKHNKYRSDRGSALPLIITSLLLVCSLVFGIWAFSGRQTYKDKTTQLIASAVSTAVQQQQTTDAKQAALAAEQPLATFNGPEAYGSLVLKYPKTWSGFVDTTGGSGYPVDGYFYPGILPSVNDGGSTNFALRIIVNSSSYSSVVSQFDGSQQAGTVSIEPYSLPKVPSEVGVKITGQIQNSQNGVEVIMPLRSQSLEVWTEGSQYLSDFNNNILPNLSFSP